MNVTSQISGGDKEMTLKDKQLYRVIDNYTQAELVGMYYEELDQFLILYVVVQSTRTSAEEDMWKPLELQFAEHCSVVSEYEANITIEIKA